jgi:hypothetical protein
MEYTMTAPFIDGSSLTGLPALTGKLTVYTTHATCYIYQQDVQINSL